MANNVLLDGISQICREAGAAILEVYEKADLGIQTKADNSPLTAADLAAHNIIVAGLTALSPEIPVLSEESTEISYETRSSWNKYFLVDPLDGTKEFINRNGEFTVNIALIEHHKPVMGVVYVPVQDVLYAGVNDSVERYAFVERDGARASLQTRALNSDKITIVASRRHGSETMAECVAALEAKFEVDVENVGSSLKFCIIAEGRADLYPRLAPTSEWDTGAAQAVVEAAGGLVLNSEFSPLTYNKKENILNPFFYAIADASYDWQSVLPKVKI